MKIPDDEEEKLVILTKSNPYEHMDVVGKYIDNEWHLETKSRGFMPLSTFDLEGYKITHWVNCRTIAKEEI